MPEISTGHYSISVFNRGERAKDGANALQQKGYRLWMDGKEKKSSWGET